MIRTIWVYLNLLASTLFNGVLVIGSSLLGVRRPGVYDFAGRCWSKWVLRAAGTRVYIEGVENVRDDRPQIFVSNHASWFDVWALAAVIPKRNRFVAKKELEGVPIFGAAWKAAGHVSIDRGDRSAAIQSLQEAGRRLRETNSSVVIFPEGTRSRKEGMLPFKKGAFMLALHTGVDIVPTAVLGTRRILPANGWRVRSGPIIVRFGEPIRTAEYGEAARDALIAEVRRRIEALLEAPAPRLRTG